eukprot:4881253-Pleurochrysis_carterae.AAC.1
MFVLGNLRLGRSCLHGRSATAEARAGGGARGRGGGATERERESTEESLRVFSRFVDAFAMRWSRWPVQLTSARARTHSQAPSLPFSYIAAFPLQFPPPYSLPLSSLLSRFNDWQGSSQSQA